jgi:hypothetical protein
LQKTAQILRSVGSEFLARDLKMCLEGINDGFEMDPGGRLDRDPNAGTNDVEAVTKTFVNVEQHGSILGVGGPNIGRDLPPHIVLCHFANLGSSGRVHCEQTMHSEGINLHFGRNSNHGSKAFVLLRNATLLYIGTDLLFLKGGKNLLIVTNVSWPPP